NAYGQPIGPALPDWTPRPRPPRTPMDGRTCRVGPLDPARHTDDLFEALAGDGARWTYLFGEPPESAAASRDRLEGLAASADPLHHAILDTGSGRALGLAAYL
ncbi:GNAT family N-acetyltransferase, partial [Methylobacterium sp. A54F]